uniref:Uncharacterized protein n=1 Tax=Anguilla anguilla TaxID=7936 RepID=A0A0E9SZT6_ANGAN
MDRVHPLKQGLLWIPYGDTELKQQGGASFVRPVVWAVKKGRPFHSLFKKRPKEQTD